MDEQISSDGYVYANDASVFNVHFSVRKRCNWKSKATSEFRKPRRFSIEECYFQKKMV